MTVEQFSKDTKTCYAVTRGLEIISEASRKLPPETTNRYPHIPWHAIRASGNIYRHEYDGVETEQVFTTVSLHLQDLLEGGDEEIACLSSLSGSKDP